MIDSIRTGLLLVVAGLVVELVSVTWLTPGTFMLFLAAGVPLCAAGIFVFLRQIWRHLLARRAL